MRLKYAKQYIIYIIIKKKFNFIKQISTHINLNDILQTYDKIYIGAEHKFKKKM